LDLHAISSSPGGSVVAPRCEPRPITATVFIDASYDGDVMVAAGDVEYTAGREANTTYNESLAGARAPGWVGVGLGRFYYRSSTSCQIR
jgi:hypothetical protein